MSDCQSIELFVWAYAYREIDYLKIHFPCNLHKIKAIRNRTEICENIFIFSYLAARCVALLLIFHFLSKLITFISFSPECNFFQSVSKSCLHIEIQLGILSPNGHSSFTTICLSLSSQSESKSGRLGLVQCPRQLITIWSVILEINCQQKIERNPTKQNYKYGEKIKEFRVSKKKQNKGRTEIKKSRRNKDFNPKNTTIMINNNNDI